MLWTFPNFIYFFIYERTVVSFLDGGLPPPPMFLLCRVIDWDVDRKEEFVEVQVEFESCYFILEF